LFDLRQRVGDMQYLSCEACRLGTEKVDLVAGWFARLYSAKSGTPATKEEIREFIKGVGNNVPDVLHEMRVENVLRGRRHGAHEALPDAAAIFSVGPIADSYLSAFGARVVLALHFEATGRVLPSTGGVFVHWLSNQAIVDNEVPEDLLAMLGPAQTLRQGRKSLEDQFLFKSNVEDGDARSAHFATFRVSFAVQGYAVRDFVEMEHIVKDLPAKVFRPGFLKALANRPTVRPGDPSPGE